jgi:uncharacterized membrane protein
MIELDLELRIDSPIDSVFRFVSDIESLPRWTGVIESVAVPDDANVETGTEFDVVLGFLGRRSDARYVVAEMVLDELLTIKTVSGPVELLNRYRFKSLGEATRVEVHSEGRARALPRFMESTVKDLVRRQFGADHARLKELLEAGDDNHGGDV